MTIKIENFIIVILLTLSVVLFGAIIFVNKKLRQKAPEVYVQIPFTPSNITINTNRELGLLPQVWRSLAQGGEEQGVNMIKPTVSYLKKLGPNYIRLDHIFDDDYYGVVSGRNANGSLSLNWSKLDQVVSSILATGARPFFSLGYMPSAIASSKIEVPNWKDWQELVRQTVGHYSSYISDVYYEVWNEPGLPSFGSWKMYGEKDYRKLYFYAVAGANQVKAGNNFKIGGPSLNEMDSRWIQLLFDYVLQNNLRLDFISWHRYAYNPGRFVEDVYEVNILTEKPKYQQFKDIEKVITEWGPNPEKDPNYSNQVASSHMITTVRKLLDKVTHMFAFEVIDGPGQGSKGWGVLTHPSVGVRPKPRYMIFDWLSDFEGKRLEALGEGSQIATFAVRKEKTVSAIFSNYLPAGDQEENFQVTFAGLVPGTYRIVRSQLYGKSVENQVNIKDNSLVINLDMPAYSVYRIDLTKEELK